MVDIYLIFHALCLLYQPTTLAISVPMFVRLTSSSQSREDIIVLRTQAAGWLGKWGLGNVLRNRNPKAPLVRFSASSYLLSHRTTHSAVI